MGPIAPKAYRWTRSKPAAATARHIEPALVDDTLKEAGKDLGTALAAHALKASSNSDRR